MDNGQRTTDEGPRTKDQGLTSAFWPPRPAPSTAADPPCRSHPADGTPPPARPPPACLPSGWSAGPRPAGWSVRCLELPDVSLLPQLSFYLNDLSKIFVKQFVINNISGHLYRKWDMLQPKDILTSFVQFYFSAFDIASSSAVIRPWPSGP